MKSGVIMKDFGSKKIITDLQALRGTDVLVGIPEANADRTEDAEAGPITNAQIGYIMEFGSPAMNIPPRPSLLPGVRSAQPRIAEQFKKAARSAGDKSEVDRRMNAAGLIASGAVKAKITTGPFAPLAEGTLSARRRRGRTGIKPLIDTGQFRQAQTYVVRRGQ